MNIYIAVVQYPMAPLDDTNVKAFYSYGEAEKWAKTMLADEDVRGGYFVDEMNWSIYEREVA